MKYNCLLGGLLLLLAGCGNSATEKQKDKLAYFDIRGYFEQESARLTRLNPLIVKTVMVNDSSETRSLSVTDWKKELSVFSDADINKASWKGQFKLRKSNEGEVYFSDNEKVPVKRLTLIRKKGGIYGLQILIKNTNSLYTSTDTLSYYPDSLYEIRKAQHIRLLSGKNYRVSGKFK